METAGVCVVAAKNAEAGGEAAPEAVVLVVTGVAGRVGVGLREDAEAEPVGMAVGTAV